MDSLEDRVVVVTGAAGGIGTALAHAFAGEGAHLVLVDRDADRLAPLVESVDAEALALGADVADFDEVDGVRRAAVARFGTVDVVCNNAGIGGTLGPMWELPADEWDHVVGVNLTGVVNGVRAFVPGMVAQGRGHVVNTASMAGLLPMPFGTPYVATKHAVVGLSATLKWELAQERTGVSASVLCPGWVRTAIASNADAGVLDGHAEGAAGAMAQLLASNVADGMEPSDVAARVVRAVRRDEFWILTHQDQAAAVLPHYQGAVDSAAAAHTPDGT